MLDVKEAVAAAERSVSLLFEEASGILLEEVELVQGRQVWSVTLSFFTRKEGIQRTNPLEELLGMKGVLAKHAAGDLNVLRLYRRVLVDATTGEFVAMKMREKDA